MPVLLFSSLGNGAWIKDVPQQNRSRQNPLADDPTSIVSGRKLFQQNCASCHGSQAEGRGHRPNLHSDRIKNATPGELEWLLRNGSLKRGMPSWSRLPEGQRWQLVTFLKSLQ
jgi:mono/diheme cytochrome c family protein